MRLGHFAAQWPASAKLLRLLEPNLRVVWTMLFLAGTVVRAQEFPTYSSLGEPAPGQFSDFKSRLQTAVNTGEVANIRPLYKTNGVTAEELNSELIRWKPMVGHDGRTLLLYFKEISDLPPESRKFWSNEAHRLTQHEVTHFAFIRSESGIQLILPMAVADGRLLLVPSEKIAAKGGEPDRESNGSPPIRSETNRTSSPAGSAR